MACRAKRPFAVRDALAALGAVADDPVVALLCARASERAVGLAAVAGREVAVVALLFFVHPAVAARRRDARAARASPRGAIARRAARLVGSDGTRADVFGRAHRGTARRIERRAVRIERARVNTAPGLAAVERDLVGVVALFAGGGVHEPVAATTAYAAAIHADARHVVVLLAARRPIARALAFTGSARIEPIAPRIA